MPVPLSVASWAFHMVVFYAAGLMFEFLDRTGKLRRFKVRHVEKRTFTQLLPRVLFNQTFILLPCMMLCEFTHLAYVGPPQMGPITFILCLLAMGVGHDVVQYLVHRFLLHNPRFRWLGHSLHHSTGAARSISACYMSSADFFLEIVLPFLVPLVLIGGGGSDVLFHFLVPAAGALGGLYEHSGYDFAPGWRFPWVMISSHAHGEHHRRNSVSYSDGFGSPGLCDRLFGTAWNREELDDKSTV